MCVDFPEQANWTGLMAEMELAPGIHPRHRYADIGLTHSNTPHNTTMFDALTLPLPSFSDQVYWLLCEPH